MHHYAMQSRMSVGFSFRHRVDFRLMVWHQLQLTR
jgi:hypothetical protein